jgi:hypothetical protein
MQMCLVGGELGNRQVGNGINGHGFVMVLGGAAACGIRILPRWIGVDGRESPVIANHFLKAVAGARLAIPMLCRGAKSVDPIIRVETEVRAERVSLQQIAHLIKQTLYRDQLEKWRTHRRARFSRSVI